MKYRVIIKYAIILAFTALFAILFYMVFNHCKIKKVSKTIPVSELIKNNVITEHVHLLNTTCPIIINNNSGKLTSAFFDGKVVTYNFECLSDLTHEEFSTNLKRYINNFILYLFVIHQGLGDEYLNAIIDNQCSMRLNILFPDDKSSFKEIPYTELKSTKEYVKSNRSEALKKYITEQIALFNDRLPIVPNEGIVLKSLSLTEDAIEYNMIFEDELFSMLQTDYDEAKVLLYKDLKEGALSVLETCKVAKIGVNIVASSTGTSKKLYFIYPYSELEKDPFFISLNLSKIYLL